MRFFPVLRAAVTSVVCLGMLLSAAGTDTQAQSQAQLINEECSIELSGDPSNIALITDSSLSTVWSPGGEAFLSVSAAPGQLIGSVYVQWGTAPESRTVLTGIPRSSSDITMPEGYGFVNDFILLPEPSRKVIISWDKQTKPVTVAEIRVFSPGEVPSDIQRWEPPLEKADMLLISTHADDEHLYFGGAMPVYAGEYGKKVQVAYFVNHGLLRTRELLAGLWEVGIKNYPFISDFPDQYVDSYDAAVRFYGLEKSIEFQVMLLRRFKPEVVLGHDLDGEYGHGAHMLNAKSLTLALDLASDPSEYPETAEKFGVWDVKKCYLHLYEENEIIMDWTLPLEYFDGRSGWEMAKAGYQHHVSQHVFKFLVRIEGPNDCRRFGLFRSTVGQDIEKNDFFENIPVSVITPPPPTETPSVSEISSASESSTIPGSDPISGSESFEPSDGGIFGRFDALSTGSRIIVIIAVIVLLLMPVFIALRIRAVRRARRRRRRLKRKR